VPRKLNIEIAKESFDMYNLILLENSYINTKVPMSYKCNMCGYLGKKTLESVRSKQGCPYCYGNAKKELKHIHEYLCVFGDSLLSTNYINSKRLLQCKCKKGHIYWCNWNNISQSSTSRCNTCKTEGLLGINSHYWKGGVKVKNVPLYITYAPQLEKYQSVFKIDHNSLILLGVECTYCKKVFIPKATEVKHRLDALTGKVCGENNLYCSEECKENCPTYNQVHWPKNFKPYKNDRLDQKQWAALVKERDNYTCQKCGSTKGVLEAHHIIPVSQDPLESMDLDNGAALCNSCHKDVHKQPGCSCVELKC